jgi:hypothetical protein
MRVFVLAFAITLSVAAAADAGDLPNPQLTPGDADPSISVSDICRTANMSELREPICASLGRRKENLGQLSVAWPRSLRIQVDVHNQALLLGRLIELPIVGPVQQGCDPVILDILAGAEGMQASQRGECPRGLEAKGVQH